MQIYHTKMCVLREITVNCCHVFPKDISIYIYITHNQGSWKQQKLTDLPILGCCLLTPGRNLVFLISIYSDGPLLVIGGLIQPPPAWCPPYGRCLAGTRAGEGWFNLSHAGCSMLLGIRTPFTNRGRSVITSGRCKLPPEQIVQLSGMTRVNASLHNQRLWNCSKEKARQMYLHDESWREVM